VSRCPFPDRDSARSYVRTGEKNLINRVNFVVSRDGRLDILSLVKRSEARWTETGDDKSIGAGEAGGDGEADEANAGVIGSAISR